MATKKAGRLKKVMLTPEHAQDLEVLMGQHVTDYCEDELTKLLKELHVPNDVAAALLLRLDDIAQNVGALRDEVVRSTIDDVAYGLSQLDKWMARVFKVTDHRGRPYKWEVWS